MASDSLLARAARRAGSQGLLQAFSEDEWLAIQRHWPAWATQKQLEPAGTWSTLLILAGRGFGKSRTGAEMVRKWAMQHPGCKIALVARTAADVRDVMVNALQTPWKGGMLAEVPEHEPSKRLIRWRNGSTAVTYSAEEPSALRGPQHDFAWCDEVAAWQYPEETWHEGVKMGLRGSGNIGVNVDRPRVVATTTPRPIPLIRELLKSPTTLVVRGSTFDNEANLPAEYIAEMRARYEGTRLGRQELYAEVLDDVEGALWKHSMIDKARVSAPVALRRIVVGVDPSGSAKRTSDEAGIVVAGIGDCSCLGRTETHAFVLEDITGRYSPRDMGNHAIAAYHKWHADRLVAEDNFGGKIIEDLLQLIDTTVAYKAVHASRGKLVRAEPIAALYEQGKVHHVGIFKEMEDEMCTYAPNMPAEEGKRNTFSGSPGRLDAAVWALTELMLFAPVTLGEAPIVSGAYRATESRNPNDDDCDDEERGRWR